ncbi:hypothetical protein B0H15DRAFT_517047 [Mycena belliarum]|uniref:Uncharacterized protein n=1 Tax=Mycena belliarum TaxID=1033014 RepID=A0AAD6TV86_9AGAR|nr:hypothetical protein B0H15DRAFT_517047 [Mycena belliae]
MCECGSGTLPRHSPLLCLASVPLLSSPLLPPTPSAVRRLVGARRRAVSRAVVCAHERLLFYATSTYPPESPSPTLSEGTRLPRPRVAPPRLPSCTLVTTALGCRVSPLHARLGTARLATYPRYPRPCDPYVCHLLTRDFLTHTVLQCFPCQRMSSAALHGVPSTRTPPSALRPPPSRRRPRALTRRLSALACRCDGALRTPARQASTTHARLRGRLNPRQSRARCIPTRAAAPTGPPSRARRMRIHPHRHTRPAQIAPWAQCTAPASPSGRDDPRRCGSSHAAAIRALGASRAGGLAPDSPKPSTCTPAPPLLYRAAPAPADSEPAVTCRMGRRRAERVARGRYSRAAFDLLGQDARCGLGGGRTTRSFVSMPAHASQSQTVAA